MDDLDIPVRPHLFIGAGILLSALALSVLSVALRHPPGPLALVALLGLTVLLSGIAFWYFPSFAKRAVVPRFLARAFPWLALLPLATTLVGTFAPQAFATGEEPGGNLGISSTAYAVLRVSTLATYAASALLLAVFALVLLVSAAFGPPWRGGEPFWRKEGPFRPGDGAALVGFASGVAWLLVAAGFLAAPFLFRHQGPIILAWQTGLLTFALAGLVHLLPRARGAPAPAALVYAGFLLIDAGMVGLSLPSPAPWGYVTFALGVLAGVAALGIEGSGRGKPHGPRLRQTTPLLAAGGGILLVAALLFATVPWRHDLAFAAHGGLTAGTLLVVAALSLLTLPVVMNQRPDARFVLPAAIAASAGYAWIVFANVLRPPVAGFGVLGLALALLLWLAALWPLRRPRRDCPPRRAA